MHRFLKSIMIHDTRIALRSDASIWLIAHNDSEFSLNRGNGWIRAGKIRLCLNDRVRISGSEVSISELCRELGIDFQQACDATRKMSGQSGKNALEPVSVPAGVIEDARRNPDTGQIESSTKETS